MKSAGLTTSLDTNDDPEDLWAEDLLEVLRYVDVFLPNEREIDEDHPERIMPGRGSRSLASALSPWWW